MLSINVCLVRIGQYLAENLQLFKTLESVQKNQNIENIAMLQAIHLKVKF